MNKEPIRLFDDPAKCCGCGACAAVCARRAIRMEADGSGCVYPVIDQAQCVGCGRCRQVCAYQAKAAGQRPMEAYAAVGRDDALVRCSASGGMFASLARSWLREGGLVAGAVMDVDGGAQVYHVLSGSEEDLRRMQGSKYVQSDAGRCYGEVMAALKRGERVLFSGTPCQAAAIQTLTGNPENLTTIDLVCHGVPPEKMLDEYVRLLGRRFHAKVTGLAFRDKSVPREFCARVEVQRGKKRRCVYLRSSILSFYKHFLAGRTYRENCYSCPYARLERVADVTIGDYWGVENHHGEDIRAGRMPARSDWSCLLVNTPKGRALLNAHGGEIALYPSQAEWAAEANHQLRHPSEKPEGRDALLARYAQGGYAAVEADFVRAQGGEWRYRFRLCRQMHENEKARKAREGSAT